MAKDCVSNSTVVIGIWNPKKFKAGHQGSWKLGLKLKYFNVLFVLWNINIFFKSTVWVWWKRDVSKTDFFMFFKFKFSSKLLMSFFFFVNFFFEVQGSFRPLRKIWFLKTSRTLIIVTISSFHFFLVFFTTWCSLVQFDSHLKR